MSFFIPSAFAQAQTAPGEPNQFITLAMFGGMFVLMYLFIIRPQRKRQKEHKDLISSLSKGDEVVMGSGLLAKIVKVDEEYITVEAADNVQLRFQRAFVHAVLPKGTIKKVSG